MKNYTRNMLVFHLFYLLPDVVFATVWAEWGKDMNTRDQFQKLIDRKYQEIKDKELELEKLRTYIQAIQDTMRLLPKDPQNGSEQTLRPGTALAKTRDILKAAGKPMHITEILKALNHPVDKKNRLSLGGSLSTYVRNGQIFSRPAPNTFGLIEMSNQLRESETGPEIPDDFGS